MRYYMAIKCRQSSYLYRCNSLQLRVLHRRKRGFTEGNFSLKPVTTLLPSRESNSFPRGVSGDLTQASPSLSKPLAQVLLSY